MDEHIERRGIRRPLLTVVATLTAIAIVVSIYLLGPPTRGSTAGATVGAGASEYAVVRRSKFSDEVLLRGMVSPRSSVFLDSVVGGRVEERFAEEGALVARGQPVIRLANTQLQLEIISREAEVTEQINNLRNTRLEMQQQELDLQQEQVEVELRLSKLTRQVEGNAELVKRGVLPVRNSQDDADELHYLKQRIALLEARRKADVQMRAQQVGQLEASVDQLSRNLAIARDVLGNLTIQASATGTLTALDPKIGEYVTVGQRIGRIDIGDEFQLEAQVDEYYLPRMRVGLQAEADVNGQKAQLAVSKIYSQVEAGKFRVDLAFSADPPGRLRRGQAVNFRLQMAEDREALVLPRVGSLGQSLPGQLVVQEKGSGTPIRKAVVYGDSNLEVVEVLEGLNEGDRVLVGERQ